MKANANLVFLNTTPQQLRSKLKLPSALLNLLLTPPETSLTLLGTTSRLSSNDSLVTHLMMMILTLATRMTFLATTHGLFVLGIGQLLSKIPLDEQLKALSPH
jgi:hypothetical protein